MSAHEQAYPFLERNWNPDREEWEYNLIGGLTKREYFAGLALQGLLGGPATDILLLRTSVIFADHAVRLADALLAELDK